MDKKQLKRIFNKNIVKDKSFIKMVCFTIVLLLVLVLGNNFGYVSADEASGNDLFLNMGDYESSDVYSVNNQFVNYITTDINSIIASNGILNHDFSGDFSGSASDSSFNFDDITYYFLTGSNYPSVYRMYLFSGNDAHCYINSYNDYVILLGQSTRFYVCDIIPWGDGTNLQSPYLIYPDTVAGYDTAVDSALWQQHYTQIQLSSGNALLATNLDVLTIDGSPSTSANYRDVYNYLYNGNLDGGGNNVVNVNYLYDNAHGLGGFDNLEGIGTGVPSEPDTSYEHYMFADTADWMLNNYSGNIEKNYKTVSAVFTSNLNDYINETENLSDYSIEFDVTAYVDYYYHYVVDNGNLSFSLNNNFANIQYTTPSLSQDRTFRWSCSYYIPESIQSYGNYDHINCEDFANNGYTQSFPFSVLFPAMLPDGTYNGSDITIRLSQLMQLMSNNDIGFVTDSTRVFNMTFKATLVHDATGTESGSYSETFDLFTGQSVVDDSSMLTNYNPDNENTDSDSLPSTSNNNNSVSATTGNVTQTVTVSNEGSKYIPSIISSLIPSSFGDTTTGLASRFTTLVDSNNFITVMANTVPAVPTTVWTYLTEYLGISLYLLACAFVLRLILDLL